MAPPLYPHSTRLPLTRLLTGYPFHDYPTTSPPPTPHGTYAGPNTFPRSQSIQHPLPATTGHGANGPHSPQHLPGTTLANSSRESLDFQGNTALTPQHNSPPATLPHFTTHHPASPCHLPTPTTHLHLLHHHARPLKMRSAFTITGLAPHHVTTLTPARPMTTESESAHAPVTPAGTNSPTSPQQHTAALRGTLAAGRHAHSST